MKIIGLTMIKNEADVIESFIRHNIVYMDHLYIIENSSTDGTRDILKALHDEGLPISVYDDPLFAHFQAAKMTEMFHGVVPIEKPDYVVLLDADEFIICETRNKFEAELNLIPRYNVGQIPWVTYLPDPKYTGHITDPLRQMVYKRRWENSYSKVIISMSSIDTSNLEIADGNDRVRIEPNLYVPFFILRGLRLGHFPLRTVEQLTSKAVLGWLACLDKSSNPDEAYQWKTLYEKILNGYTITQADVSHIALNYATDPTTTYSWPENVINSPIEPNYYCLKYTHFAKTNALSNLANAFEKWINANRDTGILDALHKK